MEKIVVTGITGSPRSCIQRDKVQSIINYCKDVDELYEIIYKLGSDNKISNSESLLLAALYGVKEVGLDIEHIMLKDFFAKCKTRKAQFETMNSITKRSKGFIISSPVYFGDRSSLIADWLRLVGTKKTEFLPLDGMSTGIVSVGAKRNGGQETTNVYALYDSLNLGACIVGNGPPTSQYGGTGVAGAIGTIIDDTFGLRTSRNTGQRVGLLSKILSLDTTSLEGKIRILFLITRKDKQGEFVNRIKDLPFSSNVNVDILDITDKHISRCRACPVCPVNSKDEKYSCIINRSSKANRHDDMKFIHDRLVNADAIVLSHHNSSNSGEDKFQIFMERTRFIRRNNFELANMCFSVYFETDVATDIFALRGMTSFLRHNVFLLGPFYSSLRFAKGLIWENFMTSSYADRLEDFARKSKLAKLKGLNTKDTEYLPVGYPRE